MRLSIDLTTEQRHQSATPSFALVFHQYEQELLVTRHAIRSNGQIAPGALATSETVEEALRLFNGQQRERKLLDANVLFSSPDETLWYRPAQRRPIWFQRGKQKRMLTVPWPALVFHARNGGLRVAALRATNKRPDENTRLYHAPLMNIYANGSLCLGNIAAPGCGLSGMAEWEAAIYDTLFVHTNHDQTLKHPAPTKDDNIAHYRFWLQLDREKATRFPVRALVPRHDRLGDWIHV